MSAFGSSRTKEPPCSLQVGRRGSAEEKGTEGIRSSGQRGQQDDSGSYWSLPGKRRGRDVAVEGVTI